MPVNTRVLSDSYKPVIWLSVFMAVFLWSAINPRDYPTWALEVFPAVIGLIILATTRRRFPLTQLVYLLILIHCVVLMIGGHYTYAEVPLFDELSRLFGGERNNYDKLGHFMQGFVPAMISREILLRLNVINGLGWLNFIIVCICLAISALYELIEWGVAIISDTSAEYFLGTQGYIWDTQSDMAWALSGAIIALVLLGTVHDRQLWLIRNPVN
jgi:putative membrane protein